MLVKRKRIINHSFTNTEYTHLALKENKRETNGQTASKNDCREIYRKEDNIKVAQEYGDFYLLQDNMNDDMSFDISIIKSTNGNIEYYTENNGKIWLVTSEGINLFVPELSKRIKR